MKISRKEVLHISRLARVGLTDDDVAKFTEQLSNILENFTALQELDTSDVPPTAQPIPLSNVLKEDAVAPSLPREDVLANAPRREGDFFRIKPVLE
jgi:aspartyl-tRNA(Asn)/glutamyl-tRNA(Gln) amidotransferase subunit C